MYTYGKTDERNSGPYVCPLGVFRCPSGIFREKYNDYLVWRDDQMIFLTIQHAVSKHRLIHYARVPFNYDRYKVYFFLFIRRSYLQFLECCCIHNDLNQRLPLLCRSGEIQNSRVIIMIYIISELYSYLCVNRKLNSSRISKN